MTIPLFYLRRVKGRYLASALLFLLFAIPIRAQNRIDCPDGIHYEIDLSEIIIKYQATSFSATLSSLSIFGNRIGVEPKMVQKAEAATQQWNEFLKGLVVGYNSCAVTKEEYAEGLQWIYPRLKEDAADLEKIREIISAGNEADEERLRRLLESYLGNLERLAEISNQEIILERIEALLSGSTNEIKGEIVRSEQNILERLNEIDERGDEDPKPDISLVLAYPQSVSLLIRNDSTVVARDSKYSVLFWNLELLPESMQPLPIPVGSHDWVRPGRRGGPYGILSRPTSRGLINPGDRIFGYISLSCPECSTDKVYWVFFKHGQGGWYAEKRQKFSGGITALVKMLPMVRSDPNAALRFIPQNDRVQIRDRL